METFPIIIIIGISYWLFTRDVAAIDGTDNTRKSMWSSL